MTIEELEVLKKENAVKAKTILEAENGVIEDAQKLLDENKNIATFFDTLKLSQKTYLPQKKKYASYKSLNTQIWNRQSYDSYETVYYGVADEILTVDSNYVIQNDALIIEELLLSPYVYIIEDNWTPQNNQPNIYPYLIPCTVQNKEVKVFQQKYQRLFQYTLELKQTPYRQFELAI